MSCRQQRYGVGAFSTRFSSRNCSENTRGVLPITALCCGACSTSSCGNGFFWTHHDAPSGMRVPLSWRLDEEVEMKVAVFGLGYVGCVSAACLARDGHSVIGVDVSAQKVEAVAAGRSPLIEPGLNELVRETVRAGRLRATSDSCLAVLQSEVSLICVGTPANGNGSLNLQFVQNVCRQIGAALATHESYHVVIVRSTVLPGTTQDVLIPV